MTHRVRDTLIHPQFCILYLHLGWKYPKATRANRHYIFAPSLEDASSQLQFVARCFCNECLSELKEDLRYMIERAQYESR